MNRVNLPKVDPELIPLVVRNSLVAYHYKTLDIYRSRAVFVAVEPRMVLTNFVDAIKPLHLLLPRVEIELLPRYYSYRYVRMFDEGKETFEVLSDGQGDGMLRDPETPQHLVYLVRTSDNDLHLAILYAVESYTPPLLAMNKKRPGFAVANAVAQLQLRITEIDKKEVAKSLEGVHAVWRRTFTAERKYVQGDDYLYEKSAITFAFHRADNGWILVCQREWGSDYGSGRKTHAYRTELAEHST